MHLNHGAAVKRAAWLREFGRLLEQADGIAMLEPERSIQQAAQAADLAELHRQPLAIAAALRAHAFAFRPQIQPALAAQATRRAALIYEGNGMASDALACRALECMANSDAGEHGYVLAHAPRLLRESAAEPAARATVGLAMALSELEMGRLVSAWRAVHEIAAPVALSVACMRTRARLHHVQAMVLVAAALRHADALNCLVDDPFEFPVPTAELMASAMRQLDEAVRCAGEDGHCGHYRLTRLFAPAMLARDPRAVRTIDTLALRALTVDSALTAHALLAKAMLQHRLGQHADALTTCEFLGRLVADTGQSGGAAALKLLQSRLYRKLGCMNEALVAMEDYARLCMKSWRQGDVGLTQEQATPTAYPYISVAPEVIRNACEFIEARLNATLRVPDVARHCGVARRTLETAFRSHKGATVAGYIASKVVARAQMRLRETDWPILRVAQEVGYASAPAFTRAFKSIAGVPPVTWRRSHRNTSSR